MKKLFISLSAVLFAGYLVSSCEILEEVPTDEITVSQEFMTHVATVKFTTNVADNQSGTLFTGLDNTPVTITGPDAAMVYNIEGRKTFNIYGGVLNLLLEPKADFSGDKEYNINVVVSPTGYLGKIIPVKFTKEVNNPSYEIGMVNKSKLPTGVSLATSTTGTVIATGLTAPIAVTASNVTVDGVTTSISLPSGLDMKDSAGNVLTGSLNTEVVSFSEGNNNTAFFPGDGLSAEKVDLGGGVVDSGLLTTAGFASITMTVDGKKVKTFEGGTVAVKGSLSKVNFNPVTDKPYVAGDDIEIHSYDTTTGIWKFESKTKVLAETDGSLYVSFSASHLSWWSWGWFFRRPAPLCRNAQITFNWAEAAVPTVYATARVFWGSSTSSLIASIPLSINKGQQVSLGRSFPFAYTVVIIDNTTGLTLLRRTYATGALCGATTATLNVPTTVSATDVVMSYTATCPNSTTNVLPPVGMEVYFKEAGQPVTAYRLFHKVFFQNRSLRSVTTRRVAIGTTYDFKAVSNTTERTRRQLISANVVLVGAIPQSICDRL